MFLSSFERLALKKPLKEPLGIILATDVIRFEDTFIRPLSQTAMDLVKPRLTAKPLVGSRCRVGDVQSVDI